MLQKEQQQSIKFDLHTHHIRCGHADGMIEEYIKEAINQGLQVIGISDHSPYFGSSHEHPHPRIAMSVKELDNYVEEVLQLKQKYAHQIDVLLGMESDFFPEHIHLYQEAFKKHPFDYIIGSVHSVEGVSIFNRKRWGKLNHQQQIAVKELYYDLIAQSARSGTFQILGHIDAMKGYYPSFSDIPAWSKVEQTLKTIAECDIAIEVNTSGGTKDVGGWYPSNEILERAHHFGVKITFGSDAHSPHRVGEDFAEVAAKLKDIGYSSWYYYKNRQAVEVSL